MFGFFKKTEYSVPPEVVNPPYAAPAVDPFWMDLRKSHGSTPKPESEPPSVQPPEPVVATTPSTPPITSYSTLVSNPGLFSYMGLKWLYGFPKYWEGWDAPDEITTEQYELNLSQAFAKREAEAYQEAERLARKRDVDGWDYGERATFIEREAWRYFTHRCGEAATAYREFTQSIRNNSQIAQLRARNEAYHERQRRSDTPIGGLVDFAKEHPFLAGFIGRSIYDSLKGK